LLLDRQWALESLGPVGSAGPIGSALGITLEFGDDNRFHGSAGCNRYFGTFTSPSPNALTTGPIGTTMMICAGEVMEWEREYLKALQDISSYKMESNCLMLFYDSDGKVLNFIQKDSH
jgi:heat shock protein HslJ